MRTKTPTCSTWTCRASKRTTFRSTSTRARSSVSGQRKATERTENDTLVRVERRYGSFYRAFTLPKQVDADSIQARYEDGVLTVVVPKAEESKPRRISVG